MPEVTLLPRVKVCGLRRPEDVAAAVEAGAGAIGLVAHEGSPRALDPRAAAALVALLPPAVLPVAVLVDPSPQEAERFARACGARAVQLCGAERAEDWLGFALPILRRLAVGERVEAELARWRAVAWGFVLDHPSRPGGSGQAVDLALAARLAAAAPCLLAGGLDEKSVAAAIARVRPRGVDASSRLESEPGRKDPARVRAFVRAALAAFEELGT